MTLTRWLLAALAFAPLLRADEACKPLAPCFSAAGVVNAASSVPGALAPNTLASIYGVNLSAALSNVQVMVGGIRAPVYYASPQQVNLVIPCSTKAGDYTISVMRDGWYGPEVRITLFDVAPAFFQLDADSAAAARPDGSVITKNAPARPGEIVVLYATGLGRTIQADKCVSDTPPASADSIPRDAFDILLGGVAVPRERILYAGVAPGFAGLYQVNLQLPESVSADPEIQISMAGQASPPKLHLRVQ